MRLWMFWIIYLLLSTRLAAQSVPRKVDFELQPLTNKIIVDRTFLKRPITKKILSQSINDSCTNVRLDENSPSMKTMIETSQASGTCYAHAAATLYDAYRLRYPFKGQKSIKPSSPGSVASIYKKNFNDNQSLDGGNVGYALYSLQNNPPCALTTKQKTNSIQSYAFVDEKEATASYLEHNITVLNVQKEHMRNAVDSNIVKQKFKSVCAVFGIQKLNLASQSKNFKEITEIIKDKKVVKILYEADYFECEDKNTATPFHVIQMDSKKYSKFDFYNTINRKLLEKSTIAMPVSVAFCADKAFGLSATECGSHAAVIIGQRFNFEKKACEFLVQDSGLPSGMETPTTKHLNSKSQKYWIDATTLISNTNQVTYIAPKK